METVDLVVLVEPWAEPDMVGGVRTCVCVVLDGSTVCLCSRLSAGWWF